MNCPRVIQERRRSLERLLGLLYENGKQRRNTESESLTDTSHPSDNSARTIYQLNEQHLWKLGNADLRRLCGQMQESVISTNNQLIKASKQRAYQISRQQAKCNIITAILQAMSQKRDSDAKIRFTLRAPSDQLGYLEWLNAMKAVTRLPDGIPHSLRPHLWKCLADHYIATLGIDWKKTCKVAFNDKINPDDDRLSLQIIKDLHRTGWSGLNGDEEKIHLKRVLLGFARFNKTIGYCQGFNIIAALVLEVMDFVEENALKVMILLIENVLPRNYFDQSLHALSVDMAVLKDLLIQRLPKTVKHLEFLQRSSPSDYEPPLTNVFSMQWFLTLFATCLPRNCLFRIWDALMLEGSEVLLRTALVIWTKFSKKILKTKSADEFYTVMGKTLCHNIIQMRSTDTENFCKIMYTMSKFPYPGISELRERYTFNIQPFTPGYSLFRQQVNNILHMNDSDDSDLEPMSCMNCNLDCKTTAMDLAVLRRQYKHLKQRQKQAAVIFQTTFDHGPLQNYNGSSILNDTETFDQTAPIFNHLFLSSLLAQSARNKSKNPPFITLCSKFPVASLIVQPLNVDSMKAQLTLSQDGCACFMISNGEVEHKTSNHRKASGQRANALWSNALTNAVKIDNNCGNENDQSKAHNYKHPIARNNSEADADFSSIKCRDTISNEKIAKFSNPQPINRNNLAKKRSSKVKLQRSLSMIETIIQQSSASNPFANPFPSVHKSGLSINRSCNLSDQHH